MTVDNFQGEEEKFCNYFLWSVMFLYLTINMALLDFSRVQIEPMFVKECVFLEFRINGIEIQRYVGPYLFYFILFYFF